MNDILTGLVRFVIQAALLLAGLLVAASVFVAAAVLAVVFGVRLLWARLTGRPVLAFGMRIDPGATWRRYRGWQQQATRRGEAREAPTARESAASRATTPPGALTNEVEDVDVKGPRRP